MNWYALSVKTGKEDNVKDSLQKHLHTKIHQCLVPKKLVAEKKQGVYYNVMKTIFPGYVLIQTQLTPELYYDIRNIPKVFYIVFSGNHKKDQSLTYFSTISNAEMESILHLFNQETIAYSDIVKLNSQVKVISGPLRGKESIIKKIDKRKRRAKIQLSFLGETRLIDVGINVIEEGVR